MENKMLNLNLNGKSLNEIHETILPTLKGGEQGTHEYTNKYGVKKTLNYIISLGVNGIVNFYFTGVKYKYQQEYLTYDFYNHYCRNYSNSNYSIRYKIEYDLVK
mgnify:FL=1|tara:strand:+ start:1348 stop:1659 length:312 start_codon:yes stop_codon:yes gene_type:complete